jgi:hypothetical protein
MPGPRRAGGGTTPPAPPRHWPGSGTSAAPRSRSWWWLRRSAGSVRAREVGAREGGGGLRLFGRGWVVGARPGSSGAPGRRPVGRPGLARAQRLKDLIEDGGNAFWFSALVDSGVRGAGNRPGAVLGGGLAAGFGLGRRPVPGSRFRSGTIAGPGRQPSFPGTGPAAAHPRHRGRGPGGGFGGRRGVFARGRWERERAAGVYGCLGGAGWLGRDPVAPGRPAGARLGARASRGRKG